RTQSAPGWRFGQSCSYIRHRKRKRLPHFRINKIHLYWTKSLASVLALPHMFWVEHQDLRQSMDLIVSKALSMLEADDELRKFVVDEVVTRLRNYQRERRANG
ncbi:MAG: hypothetical protein ABIY70_21740, partial [Capsulimonas sp.]|uniref:hypothetical protein n=1 Tax=Capsulimonas sp. TaxID=2494211 RepID=UPI003267FCE9